MRYEKDSSDYRVNLYALSEMEECVPMTKPERDKVRKWVRSGYELDYNPWNYLDEYGDHMNYLRAYRLEYGVSSGPWDYWQGPDEQTHWNDEQKCFLSKDKLY